MSEARALTEDRLREVAALPFRELLRFEDEAVEERVAGPSGRSYLVRTDAHWDWDHEPYESDLFVQVHVWGRWWERFSGLHMRDPEGDFLGDPGEEPEVSSTWIPPLTCLTFLVVALGLPIAVFSKLFEVRRR